MQRVSAIGITFDAVTCNELVDMIDEAIASGRRLRIAHHNLHSAYLVQHDASMVRWYDHADVIQLDGMAVGGLARLAGHRVERRHRTTQLDLVGPLLDRGAQRGWRVFALGGKPGVTERFAASMGAVRPALKFATAHGYFDSQAGSAADEAIVEQVNRFAPDLLLVGMGMPRQEEWLADHADLLDAKVVMPVGGLFDYIAGETRTPPRWLGAIGLEWLYRLATDPRRLAFRYLVEPLLLAGVLVRKRFR